MISIALIFIFVISLSCITENYAQYGKIRSTYKILKNKKVKILDNKNNSFTVESIGSKSIFYKHGRLYTIKLFNSHNNLLINNWTTYFDPYSFIYLILINKLFKQLKQEQNV